MESQIPRRLSMHLLQPRGPRGPVLEVASLHPKGREGSSCLTDPVDHSLPGSKVTLIYHIQQLQTQPCRTVNQKKVHCEAYNVRHLKRVRQRCLVHP